jgi:lysophospholipase L1-like esterase
VSGITIKTDQPGAKLNIFLNDLWMDYTFNAVALFYKKDHNSFNFSVQDSLSREIGFIEASASAPFKNYAKVTLPESVSKITVQTVKTTPAQNEAMIFGMSLENGGNGILYHAIGVNGAKYAHFNASEFFATQTTALRPELIIISLGTNEAISYPYMDKKLIQRIDSLVSSLRINNPQARFILVTPPDAFRKKKLANPGIQMVRQDILAYAVENGLAFYDMYKAVGGEGAAASWREKGLLRSDGVHFTKEGYAYQGNLLFNALMKSYNAYVPLRHP